MTTNYRIKIGTLHMLSNPRDHSISRGKAEHYITSAECYSKEWFMSPSFQPYIGTTHTY